MILSSISTGYKRWRHTRGYGVHSPYAYDMVCSVLRPGRKYAYYGYEDIDNIFDRDAPKCERRRARALLRLAVFAGAQSAYIPVSVHPWYTAALKSANAAMRITHHSSEVEGSALICTTADYVPLSTIEKSLRHPGTVVAIRNVPEGWAERIFEMLNEGVMLLGKHDAIIVARTGMQKLQYTVRI